jgi:hypothetical protein
MSQTQYSSANNPNVHSNTLGGSKDSTPIVFHSPEIAGNNGGVASITDTTSSDLNSTAGTNKGPAGAGAAKQVSVAGVRFSNPS